MNLVFRKRLAILAFFSLLFACGSKNDEPDEAGSSDNSRFVVGYPVSHTIVSELACSGTLSSRNNTSIYAALGLNGTWSTFFEMLSDNQTTTTVLSSVSSPTETFRVGHQYSQIAATSTATVWFDVVGNSNGGQWNFKRDAFGNVTFSYTDTDVTSTPEVGYCQTGVAVNVDASSDQFDPTYVDQHGFTNNQPVRIGSQNMPGGLSAETTYYVIVDNSGAFRLSTSKSSSQAIDITSNGNGVVIYRWRE